MEDISIKSLHYASFIIRLRWEKGANHMPSEPMVHGEMEHIQSGRRWAVRNLAEIQQHMEEVLAQYGPEE